MGANRNGRVLSSSPKRFFSIRHICTRECRFHGLRYDCRCEIPNELPRSKDAMVGSRKSSDRCPTPHSNRGRPICKRRAGEIKVAKSNSKGHWFHSSGSSFSIGAVCGAVFIPVVHFLIYGDVDPIGHGWPMCLQVTSLLSTFIFGLVLHCNTISALGVYAGLVGLVLVAGPSEYPMSSAIGLAIHGFLPAAFGAALASSILYATRSQ